VAMIPRYRYRHDDGAEDQEPHRVRRPYDIVGELVGESDPLAKLDNSCSSNAGATIGSRLPPAVRVPRRLR
jgi:hypothetical protein